MKKAIILYALLFASILMNNHVLAQTLVSPSNPDVYWYSACGNVSTLTGLNTALIDYAVSGQSKYYLLVVSDYAGNSTAGGVEFLDIASGNEFHIPYCDTNAYIYGSPDIVVGNDVTNPTTDFRVAAAYTTLTGYNIDFFLVHYTGTMPGPFTVTYLSTTTLSATSPQTIHIDLVAENNNTSATGLPFCNRFVVTWDDLSTNTVHCAAGLLSTASIGTTMSSTLSGTTPDVAGIQRFTCATCTTYHPHALIAYLKTGATHIEYADWDLTAGTVSSNLIGPAVISPYFFALPRIDADKNYNTNYPATTFSYYKIAALKVNSTTGIGTSYTFDDVLGCCGASTYWQNSQYCPSGVNDGYPSVAYGGDGGTEYEVAHYNNTAAPVNNYYMEPINWIAPMAIANPPNDFYLVNTGGIPTLSGATAVSTPCNNQTDVSFLAWSYSEYPTASSPVYFKLTSNSSFAFRQAEPAMPTVVKNWQVYPNPATTALIVNNPGGSYAITDMLGRTLLGGSLTEGTQSTDISSLAAGSYIFTGNKDGHRDYNAVVVKQ